MTSLDGDEQYAGLIAWSRSQGGRVHEAVEIYCDRVTKVSLRVRSTGKQLHPGDVVVQCPLSTTLSYLNALANGQPLGVPDPDAPSSLSEVASTSRLAFPATFLEQTPPHVVGRFFLVQQYLLGSNSHWHPYISSLPQPVDFDSWSLPALWEPQQDGVPVLLAGTNAGVAASEMRGHVVHEFQRALMLLQSTGYAAIQDFTRQLYHWAFCIFTSRSFRPSLVLDDKMWRATGEDKGADHHGVPCLPVGCKLDDFSVLLPVLDLANHDPTTRVLWETVGNDGVDSAGVAFRVLQPYMPGQQVYNNYGMKTNSELLAGYGFVLPPTEALHNDYVHLRKRGAVSVETTGTEMGGHSQRDFLLSLRPLNDASSLVGASRQWPREKKGSKASGQPEAFSRFEDALLWDLCTQMWTEEDRQQALGSHKNEALNAVSLETRVAVLDRMLATPLSDELGPPVFAELEDRARQMLFAKVAADYERLAEADAYISDWEGVTGSERERWQLAQTYREQYRAVLLNALKALDPDVVVESEETV